MTPSKKHKTTSSPPQPKAKPKPRWKLAGSKSDAPRIFNDGNWTRTQFVAFVKGQLRGARWPVKYKCVDACKVGPGVNPRTGHQCLLHLCPNCQGLFAKGDMKADHIEPVIPLTGFTTWDSFIERLFCDSSGFQALCLDCHKTKTTEERLKRAAFKKQGQTDLFNP